MQINNYGKNKDVQASSKERQGTDLNVRRHTANKISNGHITITPFYIRPVGLWRKRNVTAVGTTEMKLCSWSGDATCHACPSAVRTYSYIYVSKHVLT
jgi:hypothetical protein